MQDVREGQRGKAGGQEDLGEHRRESERSDINAEGASTEGRRKR